MTKKAYLDVDLIRAEAAKNADAYFNYYKQLPIRLKDVLERLTNPEDRAAVEDAIKCICKWAPSE